MSRDCIHGADMLSGIFSDKLRSSPSVLNLICTARPSTLSDPSRWPGVSVKQRAASSAARTRMRRAVTTYPNTCYSPSTRWRHIQMRAPIPSTPETWKQRSSSSSKPSRSPGQPATASSCVGRAWLPPWQQARSEWEARS